MKTRSSAPILTFAASTTLASWRVWTYSGVNAQLGIGPPMSEGRIERRLAAILVADVVGYSRLMGEDEAGTLARLNTVRRELIDPHIAAHKGRIVKTTGDGILIEFPSVVEAVACAVGVQQGMVSHEAAVKEGRRIEFRVGINLGDVIVEDGDIFGDGVNVAARLEALAEPGGICLSAAAHEQVRDKLDVSFEDVGEQRLKNIARPVRAYRVVLNRPVVVPAPALLMPDKPSIAVLPFENISGDPAQEYFADGMVEEIITALSRIKWLFVIARNSTQTYKGKAVDVRRVARELGVRYVVEGSVRKASQRVRITGQLIDTATGAHIWADRFDGSLGNVFELQDDVASGIVGAIEPTMLRAEFDRVKRKPTGNLDAYDCFLRGSALAYQWTTPTTEEALRLFYRAIELDPDYAQPHAFAIHCYDWRKTSELAADPKRDLAEAKRLGERAVSLAPDDAFVLCWAGYGRARLLGDLENGAALIDRALVLNPNLARAWNLSGWVRIWLGQPELAIEHLARAMRLSPLDLAFHAMETATANAHFSAGRYDEAAQWAEKAWRDQPNTWSAGMVLAMSRALLGDFGRATAVMAQVLKMVPCRRIATLAERGPVYRRPDDLARRVEALRKAGMPE